MRTEVKQDTGHSKQSLKKVEYFCTNTEIPITASHTISLSCLFPFLIEGLINILVREPVLSGFCHLYKKNPKKTKTTHEQNKQKIFFQY